MTDLPDPHRCLSNMDGQGETSDIVRNRNSTHVYQRAPIAARFEECLQYFERLSSMTEIYDEADSASNFSIESAFSQFRQWGNDTGAQSRLLDHALRKATQLVQATNHMLDDLLSALHIGKILAASSTSTESLHRPFIDEIIPISSDIYRKISFKDASKLGHVRACNNFR